MPEILVFEQPLNERIRTLLRLDNLFQLFEFHSAINCQWASQHSLIALSDIQCFFSRSDIKSEVMKELERQHANLTHRPEVLSEIEPSQRKCLLEQQKKLIDELHSVAGSFREHLVQNELLKLIRQRSAMQYSSLCSVDLPTYHYWLKRPAEVRAAMLREWFEPFLPLHRAIQLILATIRESAFPSVQAAVNGFFQSGLDQSHPYQMLRVIVPQSGGYYPEISAGKHRYSIRFLRNDNPAERPEQVVDNVQFELTCCAI